MSIDGSFSPAASLRRFLARCPLLAQHPRFAALALLPAPAATDLVDALADPFLHPSYTLAAVFCFRPLARRIAARAVARVRLAPALWTDADAAGEDVGDDDPLVVDFYVRRGRGMRLNEVACLALCRALDLAPFLLKTVLNYFELSPPPFQRCLSTECTSQLTEKVVNYLLCGIRVAYRFLLMEPILFSKLWDWSCFLNLVKQTSHPDLGDSTNITTTLLDIRWCAIQILSVILKISDRAIRNFDLGMDEAFHCFLRWQVFCQDTSVEKVGWYIQEAEMDKGSCLGGTVDIGHCLESFDSGSLDISCTNTDDIVLERRKCRAKVSCDVRTSGNPFVMTNTMKKSIEMVTMAVGQKWPVLLHGPTGAGKTALINYLAHMSRNQVLFIHMDEQTDSKVLVGTYICTEVPGEFKWQPGSLTQAILEGFWVVFEGIDKAPIEVQSIMLPLLEGSNTFGTGQGEVIDVPECFRLFATVSTSKHEGSCNTEGRLLSSALWRKVIITAPNTEDHLAIIAAWYPSLQTLSTRLVGTFEHVNSIASSQISGFPRFSLRDLLKWAKRVSGLGFTLSATGLTTLYCQYIYQEAVDVFAASLSSSDKRFSTIRDEVAKRWSVVPPAPIKPLVQTLKSDLCVGRITLQRSQAEVFHDKRPFVGIRSALVALERVACSIRYNEPVLLVGETGTGKTSLVQFLATRLGHPLTVMNLSQQSDVADLLGGFKPSDARSICMPLYHQCKKLLCKSISAEANKLLLVRLETFATEKNWERLLDLCHTVADSFITGKLGKMGPGSKRKRSLSEKVLGYWKSFLPRVHIARKQISSTAGMSFKFVEGAFITALKKGHWILLDEVNLAPPEMLHRIVGVLDGEKGTLCLTERGDVLDIDRHSSFRLFACMNPATDAGKRELPNSFRSRFTEYYIDDVRDAEDLSLFVKQYMDGLHTTREMPLKIVEFYMDAKKASEERLQDGANQKPQFSLRSLARAVEYTKMAEANFGLKKALYDGFCMFFLTSLDGPSAAIMKNIIVSKLLDGCFPPDIPFDQYLKSGPGSDSDAFSANYILTGSVKEHLKNLARAVYIKRYPVLLQGPTSSGKTSLVQYLATVTGNEFVRINNHEHTDLQEYFGSYITDSHGRLRFQEGVLVSAVRKGHWIVLDELNLAPSDVLEALNRLLDDNRELFVPELQEAVPAHPDFMLFATQNPPALYGGRKMLSRAFRNRFLEIHVDEIPEYELTTILEKRCKIPTSRAARMVEIMKDLQLHRQNSKIFAGKHGFITPRDLFRWANRYRTFGDSRADLGREGYILLAERLREEDEKTVVKEIMERRLHEKLSMDDLYKEVSGQGNAESEFSGQSSFLNIIWTKSMERLYHLVKRCYMLREPVLLVGETGGGKTSVCQLLSAVLNTPLHILNCHQYTETSDFLGGYRPLREKSKLALEFKRCMESLKKSTFFLKLKFPRDLVLSSDIAQAPFSLDQLNTCKLERVTQQDIDAFEKVKHDLMLLHQKWQTIFLWQDGPLVQAMKEGHMFLIDEISLADDSVLERLNSVLEPERKLLLAEKGGADIEKITAHPDFFVLATMNPGGDYGKKELSPALRNRFTEIWVPPVCQADELRCIAIRSLKPGSSHLAEYMLNFWQWFNKEQTGRILTLRDLLSWTSFINETEQSLGSAYAFIHGAFLVILDGLSLGTGISNTEASRLRERSFSFLIAELQVSENDFDFSCLSKIENYGWGDAVKHEDILLYGDDHSKDFFGFKPFYFAKGQNDCKKGGFEFLAPTTCRNALRVLRAMQLSKPVLLEGSPGVGKTSLVVALAQHSGHSVVRINLSEQTDMMDLLGSDLPFEGENGIEFCWSDGILLQALKSGSWVLLDELNLAPQSVLEGLNSILDHRADIFIPELGQTFKCPDSFRIFACQNPSGQGGGRKGLPKSFLNRFTKVYVDELAAGDYLSICQLHHPTINEELLLKLISFNKRLHEDTVTFHKYGRDGSPWEFNLRDVIRSCQIIEDAPDESKHDCFLNTVYLQRMRTPDDRKEVLNLYQSVFGVRPHISQYPELHVNPRHLIVGSASVVRNHFQPMKPLKGNLSMLPGNFQCLEAAVHCVQQRWLCILVGPYSSGKTSLIRILAQLTGNTLKELNLSSGTDVSELIGCFEQYNAYRSCKNVISQVERYVSEYFSLRLELNWRDIIDQRKNLFTKWFALLTTSSSVPSWSRCGFEENRTCDLWNSIELLIEIINQLKLDLQEFQLPVSWSDNDLDRSLKTILDWQKTTKSQPSAKFEWVSSELIRAVEFGEWVVLENANLCNPTVLDRINSLVEPEGSITINECGLINGKPMMLHAHRNFRLFLTVDPKHGEVSRAMRNRGVEICMMQPDWLPNGDGYRVCLDNGESFLLNAKIDGTSRNVLDTGLETHLVKRNNIHNSEVRHFFENSEVNDVKKLLILSGIPVMKLVIAMSSAHMAAKAVGSCLGVRISLLELTHWIQLFQILLMSGNQPEWSLQLSWEHTYISLLGEFEGSDAIKKELSNSVLYNFDTLSGYSYTLPGGWPAPHTLSSFILYSREACVKRNCIYLEFLGAQCASYEIMNSRTFSLNLSVNILPSVVPKNVIHSFLFPISPDNQEFMSTELADFDLVLVNKMLFIASNWAIEQSTEADISMYIQWFKWYSSQLKPYCCFFESFLMILEQEKDHPIWSSILKCREKMLSQKEIDIDVRPIPLLSTNLVEMVVSGSLKKCKERYCYAIYSLSLLRLTLQQWFVEEQCSRSFRKAGLNNVLKCLRCLENEVLRVLVEYPDLSQLYADLIEDHILLSKLSRTIEDGNSIPPVSLDYISITWRRIRKAATRLQSRFPVAVHKLLEQKLSLGSSVASKLQYEKPTLWKHGGHPFLPSSSDIFFKVQRLFSLCDTIWPKRRLLKQTYGENRIPPSAAISANADLRYMALQGVCMASCLTTKSDQDDADIMHQLEEIYQRLSQRFDYEQRVLEINGGSETILDASVYRPTATCGFSPKMLLRQTSFDCWVRIVPLWNKSSFTLDIKLLRELSTIASMNGTQAKQVLINTTGVLRHALEYSLNFSSRSPLDFSPHQTILWILDAGVSVDLAHAKIASFVLEMWYNWHSSLWNVCAVTLKKFTQGSYDEICHLVPSTRIATLDTMCHEGFPVKDYDVHSLKLKVASQNLWQDVRCSLSGDLHASAKSLLQQIMFVHRRSFEESVFEDIMRILSQQIGKGLKPEHVKALRGNISSSSNHLLASQLDLFTKVAEALTEEPDVCCSSSVSLYNLGCAWFYIGVVRFRLLLNPDAPDPATKFALKYSQMQERISLLKLEIRVRQECNILAGRSSTTKEEEKRVSLLQSLEMEMRSAKNKVACRPEPSKYKNLILLCADFLEFGSSMELVKKLRNPEDLPGLLDEACNWQVTSASFISKLDEVYGEYLDIIRPIQVAVYEMKLGLSVALTSALERDYLKKVNEENFEKILVTVYSLMQFPKAFPAGFVSYDLNTVEPELTASMSGFIDIPLLEKLISTSDTPLDKGVSVSVRHINLIQVAHYVCVSLLMNRSAFMLLDEAFVYFARLWRDMKTKYNDGGEQYYEFRPRSIKIEDIFGGNFGTLSKSDSDRILTFDHEETFIEPEFAEMKLDVKTEDNVDKELDLIPEFILKSIVLTHNLLFGSNDIAKHTGTSHISDEERIRSFADSYKLGARILNDDLFFWLPFSTLDDCLMPEHLLYTCFEYKQTFDMPQPQTCAHNIYKDPSASEMFKMVKPLTVIQERIRSLLEEMPDHPILQKIFDLTDRLLTLPHCTPLSKALFGLQVLVSEARSLQETSSRLSIADQLQPIYDLVISWQKWGVECWPILLDGVQERYEVNALELWCPLLLVLRGTNKDEVIESVVKFIETSSIGEFKRRLHLLLGFHGQLKRGIFLGVYASHVKDNLNILYNAFGYYIQFLPLVLEHILSGRRCIEKDLEESQKLFAWGLRDKHSSIENFRRTRQKIWKLVEKFNDILQQPFMVIHNQELKGDKIPAWLEPVSDDRNKEFLQFPLDLVQLSNTERFLWYGDWRNKVEKILERRCDRSVFGVDASHSEGFALVIEKLLSSEFACENFRKAWGKGWTCLDSICNNTAEVAYQWKYSTKKHEKSRALAMLLENLEKRGLSKHRPELDLESGQACSFFLQPSYNVVHLLQQDSVPSSKDTKTPTEDNLASKWEVANLYYYKNLAIMKQIEELRHGLIQDLSLEQVRRATSFVYHLVSVLQDQRKMIYLANDQLGNLRQLSNGIGIDDYSLAPNQQATRKCMWQLKQLLDSLLAMASDVRLYVGMLQNSNMGTYGAIRSDIDIMLTLIDKFDPMFKKYKESLDDCLLGCSRDITAVVAHVPNVVSEEMNKLLMLIFEAIHGFEVELECLSSAKGIMISVKDSLLDRFQVLIIKGKEIKHEFESGPVATELSVAKEDLIFTQIEMLLVHVFENSNNLRKGIASVGERSIESIAAWKDLFESYMEDLQLDRLCEGLSKAILLVSKLVNCALNRKAELEMYFKRLHGLVDLVLTLGNCILLEFLDVHKTIAEMSYALAQLFSLLFSKGFGTVDDTIENDTNKPQTASGTGMGEGEGLDDVTDQIDDENQLHGSSEMHEEPDGSERVPSEKDKGVEMEQDFDAPAFSESEDSGEDGSESGDENMELETKMGENADGKQVADEKLWDKEEDGDLDNQGEKYESGPSVQETDTSCRELRAKDDNALTADELGEMDTDESDNVSDEDEQFDTPGDDDNTSDMKLDEVNADEEPTEIKLDERGQNPDDLSTDDLQGSDVPEETESGPAEGEIEDKDEESNPADPINEEIDMQVDENIENKGEEDAGNSSMDLDSKEETSKSNQTESFHDATQGGDSSEPVGDPNKMRSEMHLSNSNDMSNGVAPSNSLPSNEVPIMDVSMPDARNGSQLAPDQPQPETSQSESSSLQRKTNPYRNIGDALEDWKEKVRVSDDLQENSQQQAPDSQEKEDAEEYRYTSEIEKGSSQTLGAATSDQTKNSIEGTKSSEDEEQIKKKIDTCLDVSEEKSEVCPQNLQQASIPKPKVDVKVPDAPVSDIVQVKDSQRGEHNDFSGDVILFESTRMNENVLPCDALESDKELASSMDMEDFSYDINQESKSDWRKYELITTRLSQELAEQLRLVMEPTLASKLQGDYRTGKRINMKKVIPYIASHFRKDKIWLRRTRPNKRDYQVVIAVDDSRSMSESLCGNVAIEALVTVCRAMSQLEVGQFAVASFGGKGNIKLLHDFDQPLTVEAGDKMISRLLFDQESTIGNQPVAGLMRYLNTMLDAAVARARTPSGRNPLNQLILIIADGKFHENKEELKRCVRDALNRRRMVAFILLDNPEEPIMEYKQVISAGAGMKVEMEKYMDSFPFPFYIILKNIEALPRTLADLLRQWFELMQNMTE